MPKAGYCNECKKNVWIKEDGSGDCGHPASSISKVYDTESESNEKMPLSQKPWFVILLLVIFPPVGIILAWLKKDWNSQIKWVATVVAAIWLLMLAASSGSEQPKETKVAEQPKQEETVKEKEAPEPEKEEATTSKSEPKEDKPAEEKKIVEPQPIELSGASQQASEKFTLEKGLSVFRMNHSGQGNFAIKLLDSNGNSVELLVNEIGVFDGSKALGIELEGEYILDVTASGSWTVRIEQPRPVSADSKPKTLSGKSQQASEFIKLNKGLTTFKLKHEGSSNFAVLLLNDKGQRVELLVNEIGSFDGSKAVGIADSGIYILDITADGNWSIVVE